MGPVIHRFRGFAVVLAALAALMFGSVPVDATPAAPESLDLPAGVTVLEVRDGITYVDGWMGPSGCSSELAPCNYTNNVEHYFSFGSCNWHTNFGNIGSGGGTTAYVNLAYDNDCEANTGVNMKSAYGTSNTWLAGGCDKSWALGWHVGPSWCFLIAGTGGSGTLQRNRPERLFTMAKVQNCYNGACEIDYFS
jgi:hypothetical protein